MKNITKYSVTFAYLGLSHVVGVKSSITQSANFVEEGFYDKLFKLTYTINKGV